MTIRTHHLLRLTSRCLTATALFGLLLGCGPDDRFLVSAHMDQPIVDTPATQYSIAPTDGPETSAVRLPTSERCQAGCFDRWAQVYNTCLDRDDAAVSVQACRLEAHDEVAICVQVSCIPRLQAQSAPRCAAVCDAEARQVAGECAASSDDDLSCLMEGDAVFQTCYAAECERVSPYVGTTSYAEVTEDEPKVAELPPAPEAGPTCEEMCQEMDVKEYLSCLSGPDGDPDGCRDHTGAVLHDCLELHCGQ